MKFKKINIAKLMNERHGDKLEMLNRKCKENGISPNSEFYQKRKDELISLIILKDEVIHDALARNIYHYHRNELVN